jgi:NAD(P)H-hydrate epimerase
MNEPLHPQSLTRDQVREFDRRAIEEYGVPGIVLMENAGRGVAEAIVKLALPGPTLICCGKGNNAGDGFVIARHLELRGYAVRVLLWGTPDELPPDAATNFRIVQKSGIPLEVLGKDDSLERLTVALREAKTIVDALLGTGARGEPRPPLDRVIDALNASGLPIVAVDLPSGLECDTGEPAQHTIRAAHTCTFVAPKPGLVKPEAAAYVGQLHVVDIGAPRQLLRKIFPPSTRVS